MVVLGQLPLLRLGLLGLQRCQFLLVPRRFSLLSFPDRLFLGFSLQPLLLLPLPLLFLPLGLFFSLTLLFFGLLLAPCVCIISF